MAQAEYISGEYELKLQESIKRYPTIAESALKVGTDILKNEIRVRLNTRLGSGLFQLPGKLGTTPMKIDKKFNYNMRIGFADYQTYVSRTNRAGSMKRYTLPERVPFQMIANIYENGVKSRNISAHPFASPAVKVKLRDAYAAMKETAEAEFQLITEGR